MYKEKNIAKSYGLHPYPKLGVVIIGDKKITENGLWFDKKKSYLFVIENSKLITQYLGEVPT